MQVMASLLGQAAQLGHHTPLFPLEPRDGAVLALSAITCFLAAGAGLGGGAILLPVLIFFGGKPQVLCLWLL